MFLSDAKALKAGDMVHHTEKKNKDGTPMRARVTSVKTWVRSPNRVEVHVVHGLRDYAVFTEAYIMLLAKGDGR